MKLDRLTLYSFRNYREQTCEFSPGINLIVGDNAQGKTNLLEAVVYLSTGRPFRTRREQELIRFGDEFCEINADLSNEEWSRNVRILMFQGRKQRQIFIGGVKQKNASGLYGLMRTVLFCPEDLMVLKSGSAGRRRLMDHALCQLKPGYDNALEEYNRLLEHKTRILKDRYDLPGLLEPLPEFNEQMARYGAYIISTRAKYLKELEKHGAQCHGEFSGGKEALTMVYDTVSTVKDPFAPVQEIYEQLREHQESHYRAELESGQCLSGPHKDDFIVSLDELPIKQFGSQGQVRTAAISLKMAEREIFKEITGSEPVLLLDDVLSELDAGRQDFILNRIRSGQVLITCCEKDRVTEVGKMIRVEHGELG